MQRFKDFLIATFYFVCSGIFLRNFAYMLLISFALLAGIFWYLDIYTMHGSTVEVPDLMKITVGDAQKLLSTRSLKIQVIDSVYDPDKTPATILEQFPAAKSRVKDSRTIYVVVNTNKPTMVDLYYKNLIGKSFSEVSRRLTAAKLKIGEPVIVNDPDQKAENTIKQVDVNGKIIFLEADPTRGVKPNLQPYAVPRGSTVTLHIYGGKDSGFKPVPELLCLPYAAAELMVKSSGFLLSDLDVEAGIIDTADAYVTFQEPSGGSFVNLGTGLRLKLSKEMPKSCLDSPLDIPSEGN